MTPAASALIRADVRSLTTYTVADARGLIKLDAMECPFPMDGELRREWLDQLRQVELNRYPDPLARELRAKLYDALGVPGGMAMVLGNGSDELIQLLLMVLDGRDRCVLAPTPSFVMYGHIARILGWRFVGVPLNPDFSLNGQRMADVIRAERPACIFLASPNNPTGNLLAREAVERVIEATDGLVVIDEAYFLYAGESWLDRLQDYEHVLIMRTMSKQGLAGLRLGVLIGRPGWLDQIDKARLPYNIGSLNQASACFALSHRQVFEHQAAIVCREREREYAAMQSLPLRAVYPSRANFILFRTEAGRAADIEQGLRNSGILIRNLAGTDPMLDDCLRVTVGAPWENRRFLSALGQGLSVPPTEK